MAEPMLRAEEFRRRKDRIAGWEAGITSYKLGDEYFCEIDNSSPGGRIARGKGPTRDAAEREATAEAERMLAATRINATE
ncbi:MAG: hypothetical protein ACREFZ_06110 [Acetobacteraceae bacterium]